MTNKMKENLKINKKSNLMNKFWNLIDLNYFKDVPEPVDLETTLHTIKTSPSINKVTVRKTPSSEKNNEGANVSFRSNEMFNHYSRVWPSVKTKKTRPVINGTSKTAKRRVPSKNRSIRNDAFVSRPILNCITI